MDAVTITRPVIVKVRVTGGYKKAAAAGLQEAVARIDARIDQLNLRYKKIAEMEKKNPRQFSGGLQQIDEERQKLLETRRQLTERLKEIGRLAEGQEIVHGRVESLVDIKVGDHWEKLMSVEVVLEDGHVVEIREGGSPAKGLDHDET
ncbi:MAG: YlqD family protein [Peptococcaceae bacterium]|nr:YlqD family protein [Peptococcaceae bacterium]